MPCTPINVKCKTKILLCIDRKLISFRYPIMPFCFCSPGTYSIVVGEHLLSSSSPSEQVYQVDSYIRHPAYRAPGAVHPFDFDIALIKVVGNIQFNENVQPLCAPPQFESLDEYLDDVSIAIGWGTTSSGENAI